MTWEVLIGDCRDAMRLCIPRKSVQTCVTSPPYFGLRDYGRAGQIGLEPTPDEFVAAMVEVFREVREVLADDGTVWLNLGDSYAQSGGSGAQGASGQRAGRRHTADGALKPKNAHGLKQKDLIGIPWRVAFALQADGWYLRQEIIWAKPNPMTESVTDRCTKAHEHIFLLAKSKRYFYDAGAIAEPADPKNHRISRSTRRPGPGQTADAGFKNGRQYETRNKRSVWNVTTKAYKGAHFATFPPDLIEPCVLAGSRPGDLVLDPFGGSGTTAGVALKHGRRAVLCELNPDYVALMPDRINKIRGV